MYTQYGSGIIGIVLDAKLEKERHEKKSGFPDTKRQAKKNFPYYGNSLWPVCFVGWRLFALGSLARKQTSESIEGGGLAALRREVVGP